MGVGQDITPLSRVGVCILKLEIVIESEIFWVTI